MATRRPPSREAEELLKALEGQVEAAFYGNLQTLYAFRQETDRCLASLRAAGWSLERILACIRASATARVYLDAGIRRVVDAKVRDAEALYGPVATHGFLSQPPDAAAPSLPPGARVTPVGRTAGI